MSDPQKAKGLRIPASIAQRPVKVLAMLMFSLLFCVASRSHADGPWQGTWATTYGQVKLRQDGRRVWGEYVNQKGVIEARTSEDGRVLRGTYLRSDASWGWFSFALAPDATSWTGYWSARDLPRPGDSAWTATTRLAFGPPLLQYATGQGPFWPPTYAGAPFGTHGRIVFEPGKRDPYQPGQATPSPPIPALWHGEYSTDIAPYAFSLSVNVDDRITGSAPGIDLAAFAPAGSARTAAISCPVAMHPGLCDDLHTRFGPDESTRASMQITLLGSVVDTERVLVAFLLSGDAAPRLLSLKRIGNGTRLQVWHPNRGVDLDTVVQKATHFCALSPCDPNRADWRGSSAARPLVQHKFHQRLHAASRHARARPCRACAPSACRACRAGAAAILCARRAV